METTNKLPEDFKKKWVAALRSGEYKQGHNGYLYERDDRGGGKYCCLGVAGALCGLSETEMENIFFIGNDRGDVEPPDGFPEMLAYGGYYDDIVEGLTQRNDGSGGYKRHSFSKIADHIEANL